jgi:hypothetical protein
VHQLRRHLLHVSTRLPKSKKVLLQPSKKVLLQPSYHRLPAMHLILRCKPPTCPHPRRVLFAAHSTALHRIGGRGAPSLMGYPITSQLVSIE